MSNGNYDFAGYATRFNQKCSDGRTILKDAFKHNSGREVPLVWNHQHNEPFNVLGHALLENREDGVYAYCSLNDTDSGKAAKQLVEHGDVTALSIYANQLQQRGGDVLHGEIREVSLVLAGANPGAYIESVIRHGEALEDEAVIYSGENGLAIAHSNNGKTVKEEKKMTNTRKKNVEEDDGGETVQDVFDTFTEKQKTVVYALIGQALQDAGIDESDEEGGHEV